MSKERYWFESRGEGRERYTNCWRFAAFFFSFPKIFSSLSFVDGGCLCHEEFNVSRTDILAILFGYGSLGFSSIWEIDDSLSRWTAVIVAMNLDAIWCQL
jgi:hypothetical protein